MASCVSRGVFVVLQEPAPAAERVILHSSILPALTCTVPRGGPKDDDTRTE